MIAPPTEPDISLFEENLDFHPTEPDVHTVRNFMLSFEILPLELVDTILELAEYWPHVYASTNGRSLDVVEVRVTPGNASNAAAALCVLTLPIPIHDEHIRIRSVKFIMESHDQGWTTDPENGPRTWFQASIVRVPESSPQLEALKRLVITLDDCKKVFESSQLGGEGSWHVQTNVMASRQKRLYEVVWTADGGTCTTTTPGTNGEEPQIETTVLEDEPWTDKFKGLAPKEFVERLQRGDRVALIAKAMV